MKKLFLFTAICSMFAFHSCDLAKSVMPSDMDSIETMEKVNTSFEKIDANTWRIYSLSINADGMEANCLNTFGHAYVCLVNSDNSRIQQQICPDVTTPRPMDSFNTWMEYEKVPAFIFDPAKAVKQIEDCKAMIPETHKFLNVYKYDIDIEKDYTFKTTIIINIQEIGKEKVESAGQSASVYYQLRFTIDTDGKITMSEA